MLLGYGSEDEERPSVRSLGVLMAPAVGASVGEYGRGIAEGPVNPFRQVEVVAERTHIDEAGEEESGRKRARRREKRVEREQQETELREAVRDGELWAEEDQVEEYGSLLEEQKHFLEETRIRGEQVKKRREDAQEGKESEVTVLSGEGATSSELVASENRDYQGRTWLVAPATVRKPAKEAVCDMPRRRLHLWEGHTKGVQQIEWIPPLGHLLLSASLDSTVRIWGTYESSLGGNGRGCKRVYRGHSGPVRTIAFNHDGSEFISSGYDKKLVLWDTESGKCSLRLDAGSGVANDVKFFPSDNNVFLAASSDKVVYQFDRREGKVVQKYAHHLSAVNTITFYDRGRSFLTTSDDKVILAWTYSIPVPIKYIQDPSQQSMPVVRHHPKQDFVACQSMDNQILTFDVGERIRQTSKRRYSGHNSAGFACDIDFSPDGNFICSGDSTGKLFFWKCKSGRKARELQAHDKHPCLGVRWHPLEPTWVATCAWDGFIKLWE